MWVIFFDGRPSFWLVGGQVYQAGKKDCHIIVLGDPSISRIHLSIEVGDCCTLSSVTSGHRSSDGNLKMPAPLTLIDSSTYGSTVRPFIASPSAAMASIEDSPMQPGLRRITPSPTDGDSTATDPLLHRLSKGIPFRIPTNDTRWENFTIELGRHGASLHLSWVPVHVLVEGLDADHYAKLELVFSCCGVRELSPANLPPNAKTAPTHDEEMEVRHALSATECIKGADYLVCSLVQPTPAVVAMLCRGINLVAPAFFQAMKERTNPQTPLPDPSCYCPPVSPMWANLLQERVDGDRPPTWPAPHPQRKHLFTGLTFVIYQRPLYAEALQFIEFSQGRICWDGALEEIAEHPDRRNSLLKSFFVRHQRHVVLHNEAERVPFRSCTTLLRDTLRMCCVEYDVVIRTIVKARPLTLPDYPTSLPSGFSELETSEGVVGESTGPKRMARPTDPHPLFPDFDKPQLTSSAAQVGNSTREIDGDGWIRRDNAAISVTSAQPTRPTTTRRPTSFKKQDIPPPEPLVKMSTPYSHMSQGNAPMARVAALDAADFMSPAALGCSSAMDLHRGSTEGFNTFDITAINSINRRSGTTIRRPKASAPSRAPIREATAGRKRTPNGEPVDARSPPSVVSTTDVPAPENGDGLQPFNIFDLEGLF